VFGGGRQRVAPGHGVPGESGSADPGRADRPPGSGQPLTADLLGVTQGRAAEGRATLLITHGIGGVDQADEIVVLDRGRITERGSHDQLRQGGGQYQQIWEQQHPPQ
jgi:ABC-type histidine transport system ATPase subunit